MPDGPSLTKEYPLEKIHRALRAAQGGLSLREFRGRTRSITNQDADVLGGLVANRYLLVREGVIVRDRLIAIVENEDLSTGRVGKILFGVWVLGDERLKRFFSEVIAASNGSWRLEEIFRKSNKSFFHEWFGNDASAKARSNVERFLKEAGIIRNKTTPPQLDLSDHWLTDVLAIRSEHESNLDAKRQMLLAPSQFIVGQRLNWIASAAIDTFQALPPASDASDDEIELVEETSFEGDILSLDDQLWNRTRPTYNTGAIAPIAFDRDALERAGVAHFNLEELLVGKVRRCGYSPLYNTSIDLYFDANGEWVVVEIKSCHDLNYHTQVRRGVSQLLEYEYRNRRRFGQAVKLLLLESPPPRGREWLPGYLQALGITMAWRSSDSLNIIARSPIPTALSQIIQTE